MSCELNTIPKHKLITTIIYLINDKKPLSNLESGFFVAWNNKYCNYFLIYTYESGFGIFVLKSLWGFRVTGAIFVENYHT